MNDHQDRIPPQITDEHRNKLALTDRQLAELAKQWGWPESCIRILDYHLPIRRVDLPGILYLMDRGQVGLLLLPDVSRLSRQSADLKLVLQCAIRHRVLIYVSGMLIDPAAAVALKILGPLVVNILRGETEGE